CRLFFFFQAEDGIPDDLVTGVQTCALPAATAAGYSGASRQPGGIVTWIGTRQPAFSGMSSSTSVRNTYSTAAIATDEGALKLLGSCGEVPVKSISAVRASRSTRMATAITAPLSSS